MYRSPTSSGATSTTPPYRTGSGSSSLQALVTSQFSRFNFKGTPVAKRLLRPLVQKKVVSGWDNTRMPTIEGVRRRGILAEAIRQFTLQVGYNKSEHEYDWSLLFAVNRKLLDPVRGASSSSRPGGGQSRRCPSRSRAIPFHPDKAMGSRKTMVTTAGSPSPPGRPCGLKAGEVFRFMELYNVRLVSNDQNGMAGRLRGRRAGQGVEEAAVGRLRARRGQGARTLGADNEDGSFNEKSLKVTEGIAEAAYSDLAEGEIIQFQRYGFCRGPLQERLHTGSPLV